MASSHPQKTQRSVCEATLSARPPSPGQQGASLSLPLLHRQSLLPKHPLTTSDSSALSPWQSPLKHCRTWPKRTTSISLELTVGKGGRSFISKLLEKLLLGSTSIPGPFCIFPRVPKWQSDRFRPCPAVLSLPHLASPSWRLPLLRGPKVSGGSGHGPSPLARLLCAPGCTG